MKKVFAALMASAITVAAVAIGIAPQPKDSVNWSQVAPHDSVNWSRVTPHDSVNWSRVTPNDSVNWI